MIFLWYQSLTETYHRYLASRIFGEARRSHSRP